MFDSIFILLIASLIFNSVKSQEIVLEKKHRISSSIREHLFLQQNNKCNSRLLTLGLDPKDFL